MNTFLLIVLGLTVLAIPAARIMAVVQGAPKWDYTQRCNLYNFGWVAGIFAFYLLVVLVVSVPLWFGFITALPVLAICIFSLIAAYDWDTTPGTFGARMNAVAYGNGSRAAAKFRMKIRRYVGIGVLGLLVIGWIAFAVAANIGSGDSATPAKDHGTTSAPASPQPAAPAKSDSASPSPSVKPNCDVPADGISEDAYDTTFTKNSIEVCKDGHWVSMQVKVGDKVTVEKWVQANGYEYDLISLGGNKVWTRTPFKK